MAAGRATGDDDEVRVDAVLVGVAPDPGQGRLAVDQVVGEGRARAEPVVHVEPDPAVRGEVAQQRDALLTLVADHPGASVDLEDRRAALAVGDRSALAVSDRSVHVESQPLARHPPELDVALDDDLLGRDLGPAAERVAPEVAEGLHRGGGGRSALHDQHHLVEPGGDEQYQADPADDLLERPAPDQQGPDDQLDHQPERGGLDGQPGGEEAPHEQHPVAPDRAPGVERVERAPRAEHQQEPGHGLKCASRAARTPRGPSHSPGSIPLPARDLTTCQTSVERPDGTCST